MKWGTLVPCRKVPRAPHMRVTGLMTSTTHTDDVEESTHLAIWISAARLQLYGKNSGFRAGIWAFWSPSVSEQPDAIPGDPFDAKVGEHLGELPQRVGSGVDAKPVYLTVSVKRSEGCRPVPFERWPDGEVVGILGHNRDDPSGLGEVGQSRHEGSRLVHVHDHSVAEDPSKTGSAEAVRRFLRSRLDESDPSPYLGRFLGNERVGSLQHGLRRIDNRDLVAGAGEGQRLMTGTASDIDQLRWWRRQVVAEMAVDYVSTDPATERAVVTVDEPISMWRPGILGHSQIMPLDGRKPPYGLRTAEVTPTRWRTGSPRNPCIDLTPLSPRRSQI